MVEKYDFAGYATKNDLLCTDGRTIRSGAFKDCDGIQVPLVWNHGHTDPTNVLGHAVLENRDDGVYAYCTFNNTKKAQHIKEAVKNKDLNGLSIYANHLVEKAGDVLHGAIREVSLVLARANPGAMIDTVLAHSDDPNYVFDDVDRGIIYSGDIIELYHSDDEGEEESIMSALNHADDEKEKKTMPEKEEPEKKDDGKTIGDVFNSMTEEQKNVVYYMIGQAIEESGGKKSGKSDEDEEEKEMKHNVFEGGTPAQQNVLSHSDEETIVKMAKDAGSFQKALEYFAEETGALAHASTMSGGSISSGGVTVGGFEQPDNVELLFPEYKDVRPGAPELITSDQGWIGTVMGKVHKSPISRIRTGQVDIRNIQELRAKGYKKGDPKALTGNFNLVRRTTDPQTIYVRNQLHRDDIIDITDFDYVQYLFNIDKMMLNEELATAMLFGDGRDEAADDKISEEHIRPIWLDDELYTIHKDLDLAAAEEELQGDNTGANFGENYITMEAMVNTLLYARETFKGSGTPDMFIAPHMLNVMLLARDLNGRRIYSSVSELATALNVGNIYTVEQMAGKTRTVVIDQVEHTKEILALVVNLSDYALGSTKGGEITHFTDFDIDFNLEKSLIETRVSGALTKCYSAIAVEKDVTEAQG